MYSLSSKEQIVSCRVLMEAVTQIVWAFGRIDITHHTSTSKKYDIIWYSAVQVEGA